MLAMSLVMLICSGGVSAYSVLTHEEIIDLLWADEIRPLILMQYPGLSEEQIKEAHAYAYGGAVIQDLGYYPFGSVEFSNLVHYVRTGDFVRALLRTATAQMSTPSLWVPCRTTHPISPATRQSTRLSRSIIQNCGRSMGNQSDMHSTNPLT